MRQQNAFARVIRHSSGAIGLMIVLVVFISCYAVPLFVPLDPYSQSLGSAFQLPSSDHWLGTDQLGRDMLSRILVGGGHSVGLAVGAVLFSLVIGVPIGVVSGYRAGLFDLTSQRFIDAVQATPDILLALVLIAIMGVSQVTLIIAVGIAAVPAVVRLARAQTFTLRGSDFVLAAHGFGVRSWKVVATHIVPAALPPVLVQASAQLGGTVLIVSGLGFLGLGVPAPEPEWGTMLSEARNYIFSNPYLSLVPGMAIFVTVLGFNLVGDALRDELDPRSASRRRGRTRVRVKKETVHVKA